MSPTEELCQLSLCFPVICIPFLNTLPERFKWRTEGLSQSLSTVFRKAAVDPLCFPVVNSLPYSSLKPSGQALLLRAVLPARAPGSSVALHALATVQGNFPATVMGGLLRCAEVVPDPGSSCSILKHHCATQPSEAGVSLSMGSMVQIVQGLILLQLGLQYLGKRTYCSDSKDKLEINKMKGEMAKYVWPMLYRPLPYVDSFMGSTVTQWVHLNMA